MFRAKKIVKLFLPALAAAAPVLAAVMLFASAPAGAAESAAKAAPRPHMMYFYNPSCRLCTATNEVVAAAEEKYKNAMTFERFDIADQETGADDVLYMFDLMDELQLPETENTTLLVFLGVLETIDGELYFTPERALVDGEEIMEKLDAEITDFLAAEKKGVALAPQAQFFFRRPGACLARSV